MKNTLANKIIDVSIDWIRHGLSCSNVLKTNNNIPQNIHMNSFVSNPVLTNDGVDQANTMLKSIKDNYDIICCSHLRRALETAVHGFTRTIHVVPFVSEKKTIMLDLYGLDRENRSSNNIIKLQTHVKSLKKEYPNKNININYSIISKFLDKKYDINVENYDTFIELVLFQIIKKFGKQSIKIVVVSHNNFIRDIIKKFNGDGSNTDNTGIWREQFKYSIDVINHRGFIVSRQFPKIDGSCDNFFCKIYPGSQPPSLNNVSRCYNYHGNDFPYNVIHRDTFLKKKNRKYKLVND